MTVRDIFCSFCIKTYNVNPHLNCLDEGLAFASVLAVAAALAKCSSFYVKVFYVMGKALSGDCPVPVTGLVVYLEFSQYSEL